MQLPKQASVQTLCNFLLSLIVMALLIPVVTAYDIFPLVPSNPFVDYVDVFPGQPRTALEAHGFSCPASFFGDNRASVYETCVFWSDTDLFHQVRVYVLHDVIQQTEFVMPKSMLSLRLPAGTSLPVSSNPFADYIDVFPGQPRTALEALGFSCPASFFANIPAAIGETCVLWPATGIFRQIHVYIINDVIQQIDFVAH